MASSLLDDLARRGPVLAVVAHPDDESFGLGAVLAALAATGAEVDVVCLTHGEASTLGAVAGLGEVRRLELAAASERLGVTRTTLHDFPDGGLATVPPATLDAAVEVVVAGAATLAAFESGGVTGHPDHQAATAVALRVAAGRRLAVIEWGVPGAVASRLNDEFGTTFVALEGAGTVDVDVDREVQLAAIACHESQARDNPVLTRRLQLQGGSERLRLTAWPPA